MSTIRRAQEVLKIEAEAIKGLSRRLDRRFEEALDLLSDCRGRVIVCGMGKPGIIGEKLSATLSSTGTPSLSLHPAEAIHGDVGRVTRDDVVIALSNSGETEEITRLLPIIKKIGAKLIAFTGNISSTLARNSDIVLDIGTTKEACPFGLAPTSSTTAMLALGDALAIALLEKKGFKIEDYAFFHPGGDLGKKLLKVKDIMRTGPANSVVKAGTPVKEVLVAITGARAGSASVVDKRGVLVGIFTDGDLRRHLESDSQLAVRKIEEVMTKNPTTTTPGKLAAEVSRIMQEKKIDEVPVVDKDYHPIGLLDVQDLLRAGII